MVTRRQASAGIAAAAVMTGSRVLAAEEQEVRELPAPRMAGGKPLFEALKLRRSTRAYSDQPLPPQVMSDLLWSAFGINRPATGDRTAPYWRHVMVIDVYAAMADGVWLYEPRRHALVQHQNADIRAATGLQDFVSTAPLNLFCASEGLASVFRGAVDLRKLGQTMSLPAGQFVTFAQTVGYPRS
jgi:hypothetical protein